VKDVATLKEFAAQAATLEKDVLFVADVDMTGEAWASIEGYAKTVRGNGYAIKGLTSPLFGTTNASIKGLHLRDINIVTNDIVILGGLACKASATDTVIPIIEHCSVSGSLKINNPSYVGTTKNDKTKLLYGGLVGQSVGVNIENCVNHVNIEVVQAANAATDVATLCTVAGIVGITDAYTHSADATVVNYASLRGCTNYGSITTNDKTWADGEGKVSFFIGGIMGWAGSKNLNGAEIVNCTNDAPITLNNVNAFAGGEYTMVGGIVGCLAIVPKNLYEIHDCVNTKKGKITLTGIGSDAYIGGIGGYTYNCEYKNLTNYGDVEVTAKYTSNFILGGCLGSPGLNESKGERWFTAENVVNRGNVTLNGYAKAMKIGGVYGRGSQSDLSNCENYGTITVNSDNTATTQDYDLMVGGLGGESTGDGDSGTATNCTNFGPVNVTLNCINVTRILAAGYVGYGHQFLEGCKNDEKGVLTITGNATLTKSGLLEDTTTDANYCIGGIGGYKASKGCGNTSNYGDIVIDVNWASAEDVTPIVQVGGFAARNHNLQDATCNQFGDIYFKGSSDNLHGVICLGGASGAVPYKSTGRNNDGDIYVSGTHGQMNIGGVLGYNHRYSQNATLTGAVNNGNIYIGVGKDGKPIPTTFSTISPQIGGIVGRSLSNVVDSTNNGSIHFNANVTASSEHVHIAGCIGYGQNLVNGTGKAIDMTLNNMKNTGNITVEGDNNNKREIRVGGIAGYIYGKETQTNLTNDGDILVNMSTGTYLKESYIKVGGIAMGIRNPISDCTNNGNITLTGKTRSSIYLAGIVSTPNGYNRENCVNNGNILMNGSVAYDCFIGGMCYDAANGNGIRYYNCINNGTLECGTKAVVSGSTSIGGIIGKYPTKDEKKIFEACQNHGNLYFKGTGKNHPRIGGLMGYSSGGAIVIIKNGFINTGNIEYSGKTDGADNVHIAGVFGYIDGAFTSYDTTTTSTDESGAETTTTTTTSWTGNVVNTGNITFSGKSIGGKCRAGGIIGYSTAPLLESARYINVGSVTFSGDAGEKVDTSGNPVIGVADVGGIVATLSGTSVANSEVYCDLYTEGADNYGMVTGSARSASVTVKNSKIGGRIFGAFSQMDQTYEKKPITASNFYDYIFGGTTDWSGVENYDGCSFLETKPTDF
jgi:hypothetical protein